MRCKACDTEFSKYEVIWRKKQHRFEDLCRTCRRIVLESLADFTDSKINVRLPQKTEVIYYEDAIEEANVEYETKDE